MVFKQLGLKTLFALMIIAGLAACSGDNDSGKAVVKMNLTDGPAESDLIKGVWITITGIDYQFNNKWQTFKEFPAPLKVNLLDLTDGKVQLLGESLMETGKYDHIRFKIEANDTNDADTANPPCYVEFKDGTITPLKVPGGSSSGFKAQGTIMVPSNGTVTVTADFDVRKSLLKTANGKRFNLKPFIRLVVDNQAGAIDLKLTNASNFANVVVFAFESGKFLNNMLDPNAETFLPDAVTAGKLKDGMVRLGFLAAGKYDLVVIGFKSDGTFGGFIGLKKEVEVKAGERTSLTISTKDL